MRRRSAPPQEELTVEQKQAKQILSGLDGNGKIHYRELKKILGRSIGLSAVYVGDSMVWHNEYMTNYYFIHKK